MVVIISCQFLLWKFPFYCCLKFWWLCVWITFSCCLFLYTINLSDQNVTSLGWIYDFEENSIVLIAHIYKYLSLSSSNVSTMFEKWLGTLGASPFLWEFPGFCNFVIGIRKKNLVNHQCLLNLLKHASHQNLWPRLNKKTKRPLLPCICGSFTLLVSSIFDPAYNSVVHSDLGLSFKGRNL